MAAAFESRLSVLFNKSILLISESDLTRLTSARLERSVALCSVDSVVYKYLESTATCRTLTLNITENAAFEIAMTAIAYDKCR